MKILLNIKQEEAIHDTLYTATIAQYNCIKVSPEMRQSGGAID